MRVMLVAQWFQPIIGGEEGHVLHLGQMLVQRGHEVCVVTLWQPGLAEFEVVDGMRVHRIRGTLQRIGRLFFDDKRKSAAPMPDPGLVAAFRRILADERSEVVHAHNWLVHSFLPAKRGSGAALVLTLHDFSLVCARKDFMYLGAANCTGPGPSKCLRCAARRFGLAKGVATVAGNWTMAAFERSSVDRFIADSKSVAEGNQLAERGVAYSIIPNFIADPDMAPPLPFDVAGLPEEPFLLYVGAISRIKGVPVLLRAYAGLDNPPPLVLIGYTSADTKEILRALPARVTYLEGVPNRVVQEARSRSRMAIVPSVSRDASPTVVLEAMAARLPIVASRIGGIPDQIETEVSGLLVKPGDASALRAAIARVVNDAALAERLAAAAAERVEAFRARAVVPRIEAVYEEAIAANRGSRR